MSFKKSKLDLLVRVRYQNPLPPPPCPPKLIDIPTDPQRYARPEFLDAVANDFPLPMIVDAECGMPLDLGKWQALWDDSADPRALNPDPKDLPVLDPADQALLLDLAPSAGVHHHGADASRTATPLPAHVPWLRKTEYISRESTIATLQQRAALERPRRLEAPDVSRPAQIRSVEASFEASNDTGVLRHPMKPHLTAVDTFEILPDADVWANAYDLFRFSERPGERLPDVDDPRLDCAIMRPMESDGDHFLAYYLTKEDAAAEQFKQARAERGIDEADEDEAGTEFYFQRDYEVVKVEQDVPNEFLLVFDDGDVEIDTPGGGRTRRGKGAYYKNIERKMLLKKKRSEPIERFRDKWALVRVAHLPPPPEEAEERAEALAEVVDPMYLLLRDAEGEVDEAFADGADAGEGGDGGGGGEGIEVDS